MDAITIGIDAITTGKEEISMIIALITQRKRAWLSDVWEGKRGDGEMRRRQFFFSYCSFVLTPR
jgi:hypothetical protein